MEPREDAGRAEAFWRASAPQAWQLVAAPDAERPLQRGLGAPNGWVLALAFLGAVLLGRSRADAERYDYSLVQVAHYSSRRE